MKPLFKMTSKYTFEEYKKFNNALIIKRHLLSICVGLIILTLFAGIVLKSDFLLIFSIVYPVIFVISKNIGVKNTYNSNKVIQDAIVEYEFYEDHFEEKNPAGTSNISYDKLNEIIETKTNFYLMISKNQGYIVTKENMPEGLDTFLREKKK